MPTAGNMYYFASKQGVASKPAVVLIHGAGGDHLHWPHNVRRMGKYRVFALDLPGHGKSEGIGEQIISHYAKAITDWMLDIALPKAVFVGHSMGGAIAQTIALENPELVQGLVLVGTGAKLPVNPDLLEGLSIPASFPKAMDLILKWSFSKSANKKLVEQVRKRMMDVRPTVVYGDLLACSNFNVEERAKEITVPTRVICGSEDKMTPLKLSEFLIENLPNASLSAVEGAGHMVIVEKPEEVSKNIRAFLEESIIPTH